MAAQSSKETVAQLLRNPLVVFGLVLVAGDGPLVIVYSLTTDPVMRWVMMCAIIIFVFGMGGCFCYLVIYKPRNLYSPSEIPERAINKSLYREPEFDNTVIEPTKKLVNELSASESDTQRKSIAENINENLQIVNQLQTAYELLLIPGYDVSVILELLQSVNAEGEVNAVSIAGRRGMEPDTIDTILEAMEGRQLIKSKHNGYTLTEKGTMMLDSLSKYMGMQKKNC
jgi:predicted transcriptional regulator